MDSDLQSLEDGPAVRGQFGVGRLVEELWKGGDGVQFVCRNLDRKNCGIKRVQYLTFDNRST